MESDKENATDKSTECVNFLLTKTHSTTRPPTGSGRSSASAAAGGSSISRNGTRKLGRANKSVKASNGKKSLKKVKKLANGSDGGKKRKKSMSSNPKAQKRVRLSSASNANSEGMKKKKIASRKAKSDAQQRAVELRKKKARARIAERHEKKKKKEEILRKKQQKVKEDKKAWKLQLQTKKILDEEAREKKRLDRERRASSGSNQDVPSVASASHFVSNRLGRLGRPGFGKTGGVGTSIERRGLGILTLEQVMKGFVSLPKPSPEIKANVSTKHIETSVPTPFRSNKKRRLNNTNDDKDMDTSSSTPSEEVKGDLFSKTFTEEVAAEEVATDENPIQKRLTRSNRQEKLSSSTPERKTKSSDLSAPSERVVVTPDPKKGTVSANAVTPDSVVFSPRPKRNVPVVDYSEHTPSSISDTAKTKSSSKSSSSSQQRIMSTNSKKRKYPEYDALTGRKIRPDSRTASEARAKTPSKKEKTPAKKKGKTKKKPKKDKTPAINRKLFNDANEKKDRKKEKLRRKWRMSSITENHLQPLFLNEDDIQHSSQDEGNYSSQEPEPLSLSDAPPPASSSSSSSGGPSSSSSSSSSSGGAMEVDGTDRQHMEKSDVEGSDHDDRSQKKQKVAQKKTQTKKSSHLTPQKSNGSSSSLHLPTASSAAKQKHKKKIFTSSSSSSAAQKDSKKRTRAKSLRGKGTPHPGGHQKRIIPPVTPLQNPVTPKQPIDKYDKCLSGSSLFPGKRRDATVKRSTAKRRTKFFVSRKIDIMTPSTPQVILGKCLELSKFLTTKTSSVARVALKCLSKLEENSFNRSLTHYFLCLAKAQHRLDMAHGQRLKIVGKNARFTTHDLSTVEPPDSKKLKTEGPSHLTVKSILESFNEFKKFTTQDGSIGFLKELIRKLKTQKCRNLEDRQTANRYVQEFEAVIEKQQPFPLFRQVEINISSLIRHHMRCIFDAIDMKETLKTQRDIEIPSWFLDMGSNVDDIHQITGEIITDFENFSAGECSKNLLTYHTLKDVQGINEPQRTSDSSDLKIDKHDFLETLSYFREVFQVCVNHPDKRAKEFLGVFSQDITKKMKTFDGYLCFHWTAIRGLCEKIRHWKLDGVECFLELENFHDFLAQFCKE